MSLGRKDVTVTRTNGGADIFRLAVLFGDDNLIRHQGPFGGLDSRTRTYSELSAHRKSSSGRFASGRENRGETPPSGLRAGAVVEAACGISANPYYSIQLFSGRPTI